MRKTAPEEFGNDGLCVHVSMILHLYLCRKYQRTVWVYYDCNI
ncbi:hypothetical protein FHX57_006789 [Paraburkholderia tropica]|nr:hypothetical protein [Paraburkholderia tropica]